jgi:hypothetical protein
MAYSLAGWRAYPSDPARPASDQEDHAEGGQASRVSEEDQVEDPIGWF